MATQRDPLAGQITPLANTGTCTSFYQAPDGTVRSGLSNAEIVKAVMSRTGRVWVDVDSHEPTTWLALAQTIDFHPLTIEDTLSPESRIKVEEYDDYLFVVVRDIEFNAGTREPYDFATCNIYLFIGKSYLITVHARPSRATHTVADRVAAGPELLDRGVDYVAYAVLDTLIDLYFPLLDQIDDFIDQVETEIFSKDGKQETLERVFELKRTLLALRRQQAPTRELMATMANRPSKYLQPTTQVYLRDVYDHVVRQVESIEVFRDLLTSALEIHFSVVSNRMNEIMKAVTIVGTFLLPATWIASIYGMNFEWMPFLHHPLGFWVAMVAMFGVSMFLWMYLKSKKWL